MDVKYSYTRSFKLRVPTLTIKVSCFFDFIGVSLYFSLSIWICMYLLNLRCFSNIFFHAFLHEHAGSYSTLNVSCFWFHWPFPLLWLTNLELYVFFEPTIFLKAYFSIHVSLISPWTSGLLSHPQRVVFLIS